jgi:glycolate oxidase iron-sulfur subunit
LQTLFSQEQLADPHIAACNDILRACVHCGFCTATCPTYVTLGNELDSPRGRIYLIKEMLEQDRPAGPTEVKHIDRCLSCLSCMTTCPSGVDYMHLVDHARNHIAKTYRRPLFDRILRPGLAFSMRVTGRFRLSLQMARLGRPLARLLPQRLRCIMAAAPKVLPPASKLERPQVVPAEGKQVGRVAILTGCVQPALAPQINEATVRLLTRLGYEVIIAKGAGCCGALDLHMGSDEKAKSLATANIRAWQEAGTAGGLDAVVINASGCGSTVKDYGHLLAQEPELAQAAADISSKARDISEFLATTDIQFPARIQGLKVAYHEACSLQHGQRIREEPTALLRKAGFQVLAVPDGHLCCGSAGTYNLLQPEIADQLKACKCANIASLDPDLVATGNIGCLVQIGQGLDIPVVHTVELLDWATGGPKPHALAGLAPKNTKT